MLVLIFDPFFPYFVYFLSFFSTLWCGKIVGSHEEKSMAFFQVLRPWDFQQIAFENCDLEKQTWKHGIFVQAGMFFYCSS